MRVVSLFQMLYENGLRSLAEMTSTAIELFRKMAEVSLLPDVRLETNTLHCRIIIIAGKCRSLKASLCCRHRSSTGDELCLVVWDYDNYI